MRHRSLGAGFTAAFLLLSVAGPVSAAGGDYTVSTSATGVSLSVLGQSLLDLASTDASADATPSVIANGLAASIAGTAVPGADSHVDINTGSGSDGANCGTPSLPTELSALVNITGVCSTSTGTVGALPTARSEAGIGSIEVDALALVDMITALLLDPINANLETVFETVENTVNGAVIEALEAACATAAVPLDQVQQVVEDALGTLGLGGALAPITGALPTNNACTVLVQMVTNAPQLSDVKAAVDALIASLLDAIADLASVQLSLNANSAITNAAGVVTASSTFGEVALALPSLDLLGDVVALAFEGPVGAFLTELTDLVSGLAADAPPIPDLGTTITDVLDTLGLSPLLADPTPLVAVTLTASKASVDVTVADGVATPSAKAGAIQLDLSPTLATLLGAPASTTVAPGDEVVLLEGTPLESRLAVGNATTDEAAGTARGEAVTVELFRTTSGGIILNVGDTNAAGSATVVPGTTPSTDPLPVTGGGSILAALAALGASRGLRRKR